MVIVPISSRKIEPPSASANLPRLVIVAPVKAPRTWPNSSDSSSVSGIAAQFDLDERHVALGAAVMDRARDHLLAGARLAGDEHGALRLRDELGALNHFLHGAASPDDAVLVEFGAALADQVLALRSQALVFERVADQREQLFDLERLLQVVQRAELHRLDRAFDRRVRRHHQHLRPLRRRHGLRDARESARARSSRASRCRRPEGRMISRRAAAGRRGPEVVSTTSCPSSRNARPRRLRIFSSSSASRMDPRMLLVTGAPREV